MNKNKNLNETHKELYKTVQKNNSEIEILVKQKCDLLKKPVIEPPMNLVMAEPAYEFMRAMLDYPMTKDALKEVKRTEKK